MYAWFTTLPLALRAQYYTCHGPEKEQLAGKNVWVKKEIVLGKENLEKKINFLGKNNFGQNKKYIYIFVFGKRILGEKNFCEKN